MLDIDTYKLRAKNIYKNIYRRVKILEMYDRFLKSKDLEPNIDSLNLWIDSLDRRGLSEGSIVEYTYVVLSYFNIMMIDVDDRKLRLLKMRLPKRSIKPAEFLTVDEVSRLINGTEDIMKRLIYSLAYTYARRLGEVLQLTWDDVDLDNGRITFTILKKNRFERAEYELESWIVDMFKEYIEAYFGGRVNRGDKVFPISIRTVQISFKKDCRRCGIPDNGRRLRPHLLRHSRITHLSEMGVPLETISKELARHSRLDTTFQFYLGVTKKMRASIPKASDILTTK